MLRKKKIILPALLLLRFGTIFADDTGGLSAVIDIDVKGLEIKSSRFSDENLRPGKHGTNLAVIGPTGWDFLTSDSYVKFGYDADLFGGFLKLNKTGLAGVKAWVRFGRFLKLTAGNDIKSVYARSLGADPELRVYYGSTPNEWDISTNPDNITQDKGLLLEGFFGPVSAALAGGFHIADIISKAIPNTDRTQWADTADREFQYGGRVGSEIGDLGKVNLSYILRYKKIANNYNFNRDQEMTAIAADAKVFSHLFGVYGSLKPLDTLELTLGYGGILTKYLNEFYRTTGMVQTLVPLVFRNGINLNARYRGIPNLTIRTDHNLSFWQDRDYRAFGVIGWDNIGLSSQTTSATSAVIRHWLVWNGVGVSYNITKRLRASIYLRNLYRQDNAKSSAGTEYKLVKDKFAVEPKVTWKVNDRTEVFAGIIWEFMITTASEDLNSQGLNTFLTGTAPRKTIDSEQLITIPMGITMKF
jgi:hypothetical protein